MIATATPAADILLVDDDPGAIQLLARMLAGVATLRFATNGFDALRLVREHAPDLMLLDADMPGMSGLEVCQTLKEDPSSTEIPVIFITSHVELEFQVSGFDAGAADFISKPVSAPLMLARVRNQLRAKQLADELRRVSTIDALTGVANRRAFDTMLEREWMRARRASQPLALLMIDVDHFKLYNDRYGHPAGDTCLRAIAKALGQGTRRPADLLARIGGEEFAMLLPHTTRSGAIHVASQLLDAVAGMHLAHAASPSGGEVGVSVGVSCYDEASACWIERGSDSRIGGEAQTVCDAAQLMQAADLALYAAKRTGRARAMLLDMGDTDTPAAARHVASAPRAASRHAQIRVSA